MALKFKEPQVIRATYRIVTPMFIGDAEQKASGISPASIKGALRFWWRALRWGQIRSTVQSDTAALQRLHQEEGQLFGTSADNGNAAQFTLRLTNPKELKITHATDWPNGGNDPSGYLGIGLWESGSHAKGNFQPHREYIREGQKFSIELIANPSVSIEQHQQLSSALIAWGLLGGLGSRSRRAFGSIAIESLNSKSYTFTEIRAYQNAVSQLLEAYRLNIASLPPFTALSNQAKFGIGNKTENSARVVHSALGVFFRNYRGQPSSLRGSRKRVFGLPYSGGTRLEGEARRASPLLFHVHPIGTKFVGATLFLPAVFHHDAALAAVEYPLARGFLNQLPEVILL